MDSNPVTEAWERYTEQGSITRTLYLVLYGKYCGWLVLITTYRVIYLIFRHKAIISTLKGKCEYELGL
ncbi:hypothetical protein BABINDRAFT_160816 [Babjeviella inositovora NRRL Y-12698]|uniref:Mononegavirus-type SAM-dependent 2'-O-MTase domain-containing protein n=1 Tax=Babjeviella inositovora NRRL Y-12698 TaxID=984486 RepID=A0A1E3QSD1_9ASCO|nr:uncharacterized protein BABINDRAFT_160816 [Babjeviella inositovora NRRL Y-12698]ODQ80548.1 hypothetical protein BABINDRAFT_160816 [Babjeviella inositovora NRRL Y-12698]